MAKDCGMGNKGKTPVSNTMKFYEAVQKSGSFGKDGNPGSVHSGSTKLSGMQGNGDTTKGRKVFKKEDQKINGKAPANKVSKMLSKKHTPKGD